MNPTIVRHTRVPPVCARRRRRNLEHSLFRRSRQRHRRTRRIAKPANLDRRGRRIVGAGVVGGAGGGGATPASLASHPIMIQNVNRRLQSPLRMVAVERLPNPLLGPVNQPLRLLQSELHRPRMRPGQLAQITRRHIQLTGGGADIRVMLRQRTLARARSSPRQLAGTGSRRTGARQLIPTPTQPTAATPEAAQQTPPAAMKPPIADDDPKPDWAADAAWPAKGRSNIARSRAIRGPASPCRQRYLSPRRRRQCRQQRWSL